MTAVATYVPLPVLSRGRFQAVELVSRMTSTIDQHVAADASAVQVGTRTFADALVTQTLVRRPTQLLTVMKAPLHFAAYLRQSADRLGVSDRLTVRDAEGHR